MLLVDAGGFRLSIVVTGANRHDIHPSGGRPRSLLRALPPRSRPKKMATSRSQLGRVLDTSNVSFQFDTLIKAVSALSKEIKIKIKRATKKEAG